MRFPFLSLLAGVLAVLLPLGTAAATDFAALAAQLDSEQFRQREAAEQALLEGGLQLIAAGFAAAPLPANASDDQIARHFVKLQADIRSELEKRVYQHLAVVDSPEVRFRAQRIRKAIDQRLMSELASAQVGLSKRLPADIIDKVYGYTRGFRDGTTWFDARIGNKSQFTVTSIRILVRLTHKGTGKETEKEVVLSSPAGPLLPGQQAVWSADVGLSRTSDHEFFWTTLAVFGSAPAVQPNAGEGQRSSELP